MDSALKVMIQVLVLSRQTHCFIILLCAQQAFFHETFTLTAGEIMSWITPYSCYRQPFVVLTDGASLGRMGNVVVAFLDTILSRLFVFTEVHHFLSRQQL